MVLYGGADRTVAEWEALVRDGGFILTGLVAANQPFSFVSARPEPS